MSDKGWEKVLHMKLFLMLILNDETFIIYQVGKVDKGL